MEAWRQKRRGLEAETENGCPGSGLWWEDMQFHVALLPTTDRKGLLHDVTGPKQPEPHGCGVKGKRLTGIVPGLSVFHTVLPACSTSFLAPNQVQLQTSEAPEV